MWLECRWLNPIAGESFSDVKEILMNDNSDSARNVNYDSFLIYYYDGFRFFLSVNF